MNNEIWKDIIITKNGVVFDFTGKYQVSSEGRVRLLGNNKTRKEKIFKQHKNNCGYLYVGLRANGKQENFLVGRLVATMFIPNPNGLPEVNHINENKEDNRIENLEWCDKKYNINHGTRNKRQFETKVNKGQTKKIICLETGETYDSVRQAVKIFGGAISDCCSGKQVTSGDYHWMYYDEYLKMDKEEIDAIKNKKGKGKDVRVKIICLETNQKFNSIKEAEEWLGLTGIGACCRGKCETIGKLHWKYYKDYVLDINDKNEQLVA